MNRLTAILLSLTCFQIVTVQAEQDTESSTFSAERSAFEQFVAQQAFDFTDANIEKLKQGYVKNSMPMFFCQEHQTMEPEVSTNRVLARRELFKASQKNKLAR
ncbi:hypothetical protein [Agarivorans sp.]|uniref:hypothetical protein n=1 Tax=Agarivorans sp. TaxID=1872412 RepID=UPI003CFC4AD4